MAGELAVTAVSFHAYAHLADRYVLLPHGASFGDGYGPVVVARAPISREAIASGDVVVASPGPWTTAALALRLWAPGVSTEALAFDRIQEEVAAGRKRAGLLIHEGQLTFRDEGLTEIVDLGRWWKEETGLPLPLGGNVVRRDLGEERIGRISRALSRSIEYGLAHRSRGPRPRDALRPRPPAREGRPVRRDVRERLDAGLRRSRPTGGAGSPRSRARGRPDAGGPGRVGGVR